MTTTKSTTTETTTTATMSTTTATTTTPTTTPTTTTTTMATRKHLQRDNWEPRVARMCQAKRHFGAQSREDAPGA
eukprot:4740294-Pyramimonas_sp.AAC.1